MSTIQRRILGIDTGSRHIGISVFSGEELIFYGIKVIKAKNEADTPRLQRIITNLIETYQIDLVAIERLVRPQQESVFIRKVYMQIIHCVRKRGYELTELDPRVVRSLVCKDRKPTRIHTSQILSETYSELKPYSNMKKIWSRSYYAQLFDGIAVGLACARLVTTDLNSNETELTKTHLTKKALPGVQPRRTGRGRYHS